MKVKKLLKRCSTSALVLIHDGAERYQFFWDCSATPYNPFLESRVAWWQVEAFTRCPTITIGVKKEVNHGR